MEAFTFLSAWRNRKKANGFVLTELVAALAVAAIVMTALLPMLVQTAANCRYGESWEELSRQGMVMEETIFGVLRFARNIEVSPKTVRCRDEQNGLTGFSVKNGRVYRLLSNGSEQPLTGSVKAGLREDRISVRSQGDRPYFSADGEKIHVYIELYDAYTGQSWPCVLTVTPLPCQWEDAA